MPWPKGRLKTPAEKERIRAALTGRKRPPEVVEKLRAASTGRFWTDDQRAAHSAMAVAKGIGAATRAKWQDPEWAEAQRARLSEIKREHWREKRAPGEIERIKREFWDQCSANQRASLRRWMGDT